MTITKTRIIGAVAVLALAGCSASGSSPQNVTQSNVAANVLQFAVGTANVFGVVGSLNVVATYRQPKGGYNAGASGTLLNSPTLTFPAATGVASSATGAGYDASSTVLSGPSASETSSLTSTSQVANSGCAPTSFGQSGGVFGVGIEPFNSTGQADCTPPGTSSTGTPFQVAPYPIPLFAAALASTANVLEPIGGPPSFELAGNPDSVVGSSNSTEPSGTAGISEGVDVLNGVAPVAGGAYGLSVAVPSTSVTQKATFTLPGTLTTLGTATAPAFTPDTSGDGGGTFAFTMPTGATEAYLEVIDYGPVSGSYVSCNGWASAGTPVYYTLETTSSGTLTLPPTIGPTAASSVYPNGAAAGSVPSTCTAAANATANGGAAVGPDQVVTQVIAFDYPAYESSYPSSLGNPAPPILGAAGSDDITISTAVCSPSCTASLPLLRRRSAGITGTSHRLFKLR